MRPTPSAGIASCPVDELVASKGFRPAAVGAVALGAASAATHGDIPGLAIALQHIPPTTHGYEVVTAVKNALVGGAAGGGIGAAVAAVAKGAHGAAAASH